MIEADHMVEALCRWRDFERVQLAEGASLQLVRVGRGSSAEELGEAIGRHAEQVGDALSHALAGRGVGVEASGVFTVGMRALLKNTASLPPEAALDQAALVGMIVGLTAKELADEG